MKHTISPGTRNIMDKEHIRKLAENPKFIPGIYNYCDRWCERCPFTSRCLNFALSEEQFGDSQARDINNEDFWDRLSEMFQVTLEMVKETAEELGIDLESIDYEAISQENKIVDDSAENYRCVRAAKAYGKMVNNWFDSSNYLLEEKADELSQEVRLELPGSNPQVEILDLKDSVDIIRWYQHQIYVKLKRAVSGSLRDIPEGLDKDARDSNGSAKVALIAIDRSIAAWGQMRKHFPERKDDILDILVHLDGLRRKTQTLFPDARSFVRPGFDDTNQGA